MTGAWSVYLHGAVVLVPTQGQAEAGFYVEIEPVEVVPALDAEAVAASVERVMARGNPRVEPAASGGWPKPPVVPKAAGVRSWAAFERTARGWSLSETRERFRIVPLVRTPPRGLGEDAARAEVLPAGSTRADAARRMAIILLAAARGTSGTEEGA